MTFAIFISGWFAGVLSTVFVAVIGLRASDRTDQLSNDLTQISGAGGGEVIKHHGELK